MIKMLELLKENGGTPAEQAKALGYVYLGFRGWGDPDDRIVRAKTIDGKLVKVSGDDDDASKKDLGRLAVLSFDSDILHAERHGIPEEKVKLYGKLLSKILHFGGDFLVFTARTEEKDVARFLRDAGVSAGVKLVPFGSSTPQKKRTFIEKKIKAGYKQIQYFDNDAKSIAAVESLKAPYNKLSIQIECFDLPNLSGDQKAWSDDV